MPIGMLILLVAFVGVLMGADTDKQYTVEEVEAAVAHRYLWKGCIRREIRCLRGFTASMRMITRAWSCIFRIPIWEQRNCCW